MLPKNNFEFNNNLFKYLPTNRLKGLWRLMQGYQIYFLVAAISIGIATLARTGTYLLLRFFIDDFLTQGDRQFSLPIIAMGFIVLALVQGSFTFNGSRLAAKTAESVTRRLRNYLFDHIQHLTFSYHNSIDTGELVQRVTSDVDALNRFYADQSINLGQISLLFLVNFFTLLFLNQKLAFVSIIAVPIIVTLSLFFFRKIIKAYEAYQEQEAVLSTTLQENLSGVRVVKAFARQQHEINKFDQDNMEKFLRGKRLLTIHSVFWPISDIVCFGQLLAGYYIGAMMAINGEITIGTYLAYAGIVMWIIFPLRNLGRLIVQASTGLVSYSRVLNIIKEEREPLDQGNYIPDKQPTGHLTFDHVSFEYEPNTPVLKDISFSAHPGQVIALLGSTGSGKTTLVNLLPRFFDYTSGSILLDGIELNRYPRRYLRRHIGIVEQEPFLFSRSIAENISYGVGDNVSQQQIEEAARYASIHDVIQTFPEGYKTIVGEKGVTLSGGQKQRLSIARVLLKNPEILILDDSTSSVDTETEAEIRTALQKLMIGRTTFIIAHRIQTIMSADHILVMDKGEIIQHGKHHELVQQDGLYAHIFEIQSHIEMELEKEISSAS